MGKKKIIGLCLAVGLMVGVVGGSLAWFTDTDTLTNNFATQGNESDDNKGIKIDEDFESELAQQALPGTKVNKDVRVENKASYPQLIRVNFEKKWKDGGDLKPEFIELGFQNLTTTGEEGKWIEGTDGYYYFNKVVESNGVTADLLDYVKLSKNIDSTYKNKNYDVIVNAESIQASNGAVSDAWKKAPEAIKALGGTLE